MTQTFFDFVSGALARKTKKSVTIRTCGNSTVTDEPEISFGYLRERISIRAPGALIEAVQAAAGGESVQRILQSILDEESFFVRNRVVLCKEPDQRDGSSVIAAIEITIGGQSFVAKVSFSDLFHERLRSYGRMFCASVLRVLNIETAWTLRSANALGSFLLLLRLRPGERIALNELLQGSCELVQEQGAAVRLDLAQFQFTNGG